MFQLNLDLIKRRFAKRDRDIEIETKRLIKFATEYWNVHKKMRWNGRQIRNACQTALALAEFESQGARHEKIMDENAEIRLTLKHMKTVGKAYLEFNQYLDDVYGRDAERRAKYMRIRAREGKGKVKAWKLMMNKKKDEKWTADDDSDFEDEEPDETQQKGKGERGKKQKATSSREYSAPPSSLHQIPQATTQQAGGITYVMAPGYNSGQLAPYWPMVHPGSQGLQLPPDPPGAYMQSAQPSPQGLQAPGTTPVSYAHSAYPNPQVLQQPAGNPTPYVQSAYPTSQGPPPSSNTPGSQAQSAYPIPQGLQPPAASPGLYGQSAYPSQQGLQPSSGTPTPYAQPTYPNPHGQQPPSAPPGPQPGPDGQGVPYHGSGPQSHPQYGGPAAGA